MALVLFCHPRGKQPVIWTHYSFKCHYYPQATINNATAAIDLPTAENVALPVEGETGLVRFVHGCTVYPKKYAHGFVVLCFVVVTQSFIMNSHEVFIHIHQGCFAGTGAIVRLPQCQWSKPDGYGKISQCITTTKHSKAKTVCIFLGIYCTCLVRVLSKLEMKCHT